MTITSSRLGTGGWHPGLRRDTLDVTSFPKFLASEKLTAKRGGITLAASTVTADANGDKILPAGQFVVKVTSGGATGSYGPYASGATDGRQSPVAGTADSGYLFESVNLRDGDVVCGLMIEGSVIKKRVTPSSAAAMDTAVAGRIIFQ
jgi:hypothetical protein